MSHSRLHYSMSLLMSLFTFVGGLAVPLLAVELGASKIELGILGSAAATTYVLAVVYAGTLSDRLGRKQVLIGGATLTALVYCIVPLSRGPWGLIFFMGLVGAGLAFFWPVMEAWLSEEGDHEDIRKGLGGFNVSWSIGCAMGPFIGGLIYTISSTLAFLVTGAGVGLVAFLAYLHKTPPALSESDAAHETETPKDHEPIHVSRSLLYIAWIGNFASWFAITEVRTLFPALGVELGMPPSMIGTLMFALGTALTGMFYIMGASGRWHNRISPLFIAQGANVLFLILMSLVDSALVFALLFAGLGAGFGVTYSYSLYYSVVGSLNKGAASGRHERVLGTGALLGPVMGGSVSQIFGTLRASYALGAALVFIAILAEIFVLTRKRSGE